MTTQPGEASSYLQRLRGGSRPQRQRPGLWILLRTWLAVVVAVVIVAMPHYVWQWSWATDLFLVASFGSTIVLLFGAPRAEFAQPRNVLAGHIVSALCGVTAFKVLGQYEVVAVAVALATSILLMQVIHAVHPPAGATAVFAVIGGPAITGLGYLFVLIPIAVGMVILVALAVIINNAFSTASHHYPVHWW